MVRLVYDRSRDRAQCVDPTRPKSLLRGLQPAVGAAAAGAARHRADRRQPARRQDIDLATPQQSGALVLFLVAYYGLFASVMGGMAVALDTTAGERERQSLEPLLMTPARPGRARRRQVAAPSQFVQCARRAADADRVLPDAAVRAVAAGRRAVPVRHARIFRFAIVLVPDGPRCCRRSCSMSAAARAWTSAGERVGCCCCRRVVDADGPALHAAPRSPAGWMSLVPVSGSTRC